MTNYTEKINKLQIELDKILSRNEPDVLSSREAVTKARELEQLLCMASE